LRSFGLGGDYDLRRAFSAQQKSAITRKYNQFKTIVDYSDNYQILTVKNKTAKEISVAAKKIKLKGGKTKLIVPIEKGQKVTIKRGRAVFSGGGFEEEVYKGGWDLFENAKKVFAKKLKKGEYISVRIGDHRPFHRNFPNLNSMLYYMQDWQPKEDNKEELISHISITRIKGPKERQNKRRTSRELKQKKVK